MEYIKRSSGGNVCRKAAYNMRDKIVDEKTGEVFSFKNRGGCIYHEVLLPTGVNEKFKDSTTLWNAADLAELRGNSQLAKEVVLALPDNKEITLDDKVELAKRFANSYFVDKGVAVQVDIHAPHHDKDKNWHAHLMITTRRFTEDGNSFSKYKARDLDAQVRKFKVVEGESWGQIWRDLQNDYFKEKGLDIRVDEIGAIAQEHLGPVRMRKHMSNIQQRAAELKEANKEASTDPDIVLKHLSRIHAAFTEKHLDNYLNKHVIGELRAEVKNGVLTHPNLVQLYHKHTGEKVGHYTTKEVRAEEERVVREGDRINLSAKIQAVPSIVQRIIKERTFSEEQLSVFEYAVRGDQGVKIIEGRAGTGKSYLMHGIREAYERSGGTVVGLAKANTVKNDMLCSGFSSAYTVKKYMFLHNNNKVDIKNGSVFIVDEAALLETPSFNELFKVAREHSCKVILVGDDRQQTSIERGGMFPILAERYGSQELKEVRRQAVEWQKHVSEYLSEGSFGKAIGLLEHNQRLHWNSSKEDSFSALVEQWCRDSLSNPEKTRLILAHRNVDVDTINQAIQQVQQSLGKVSTKEFVCETNRGPIGFGEGDRVLFSSTDKELGLFNGDMGTLVDTTKNKFLVLKDSGEKVSFDPGLYAGLNLAYATTIFKGQGKTVDTAYVFHSPTMNEKQAYVSLTRQINDIHLYASKDETKNGHHLAIQMGKEDDKISSLEFHTEAEVAKHQKMGSSSFHKLAYNIENRVKGIIHKVTDRLHHNAEFYRYTSEKTGSAAPVRERDAIERWKQEEVAYAVSGISNEDGPNASIPTAIKKIGDILENNGYTTAIIEPNRTGEDFNDVLKKEGKEGVGSYFNGGSFTQKEILASNPNRGKTQERESFSKTPAEVNANLTTTEKLVALTKQYQKQLETIFKEKVGASYKHSTYKVEIDAIAYRTAQEILVRGNSNYSDQVLLAKNQYELKRLEELKSQFTSADKKVWDTWMQHYLKAEMVVAMEGKLFAEVRNEKNTLSKDDKAKVQQEARGIFNDSSDKLKAYQNEAHKSFGLSSESARMFAIQRLTVEEKYGFKSLNHEQSQALLKAVEHGQQQYTKYHEQYAEKLKVQNDTMGDRESKYIDLAAKYKAHQEGREIIVHTLSSKDGAFPNKQELQKIETIVEKGFRENKSLYDKQQLQQQKVLEKAQTRQDDRSLGR